MQKILISVVFYSAYGLCLLRLSALEAQQMNWRVGFDRSNADAAIASASIVSFSPDSSIMAVGCSDSSVRLWDLREAKELRRLVGHTKAPNCISFSPDGARVVTCADQEYPVAGFRVWSVATGECLYTQDTSPLTPFCKGVLYHPSGRTIIAETHHQNPIGSAAGWTIDEYDAKSLRKIRQLATLNYTAMGLMCSADGRLLLIGNASDNSTPPSIFDFQSNKLRSLGKKDSRLYSAILSEDGLYVASANWYSDGVSIVDAQSEAEVRRLRVPPDANERNNSPSIRGFRFSPDHEFLYALCDQSWVQWKVSTGEVQSRVSCSIKSRSQLAINKSGRIVGIVDNTSGVVLWDVVSKKPIARFTSGVNEGLWLVETADGFYSHSNKMNSKDVSISRAPDRSSPSNSQFDPDKVSHEMTAFLDEALATSKSIAGNSNSQQSHQVIQKSSTEGIGSRLFVLTVGVSLHSDPRLNLGFAHADAESLADLLSKSKGKSFRDVQVQVYTNTQATVTNVKEGLKWLQRSSTKEDTIVVLFAGHGLCKERGLYFVTHEANLEGVQYTCVNWETVATSLQATSAKRIVFLMDTCFAGAFSDSDLEPQRKIATSLKSISNLTVFASSGENELALEDTEWQHGAFTTAVLESLAGKADTNQDGSLSVAELISYSTTRVSELTDGKQNPTVLTRSESERLNDFIRLIPD